MENGEKSPSKILAQYECCYLSKLVLILLDDTVFLMRFSHDLKLCRQTIEAKWSPHMCPSRMAGRGVYYLESQNRKGGGLCDNHPEVNTIDSSSELSVMPLTLSSSRHLL